MARHRVATSLRWPIARLIAVLAEIVARTMGHTDTRTVERVYGRTEGFNYKAKLVKRRAYGFGLSPTTV